MVDPVSKSAVAEWSGLDDDELIHRIVTLPKNHGLDKILLEIVGSDRHFFVQQMAAQKIEDSKTLHEHWDDRHVGQIVVRGLSRSDDLSYLESLKKNSRYIDVRKAADAQIKIIRKKLGIDA
jgi:hypothetical protein